MIWEMRGDAYYSRDGDTDYMIRMKPPGWGLYAQAVGDERWELVSIYASVVGAQKALQQGNP